MALSQAKLTERLNASIPYNNVSKYEHDVNEPPLMVLLAYSRVAGVRVEDIIDDEWELREFKE